MSRNASNGRLPAVPIAQLAFDFVSRSDRRKMANRYRTSLAERQKRAASALCREQDRYLAIRQLSVELLRQPLYTRAGEQLVESFAKDPIAQQFVDLESDSLWASLEGEPEAPAPVGALDFRMANVTEADKKEYIEWIADRAPAFVGWVLDRSLEALACLGNGTEKHEILQWIYEPRLWGHKTVETEDGPTQRPVWNADIPFTFAWCCKASGLREEELQEKLIELLQESVQEVNRQIDRGRLKPGRAQSHLGALRRIKELTGHD